MDQTDHTSRINRIYRLLALCARAEGHPIFYEQLARQVEDFTDWQELPAQAELHGMAPLLWYHIHNAGIDIPQETARIIRGLYLRHHMLNQAHTRVLIETNTLFMQAGIQALLLKGLALAYQYYPEPALRPVSDIDLLLKQSDVLPAMDLLAGAGFRVDSPRMPLELIPKELTADSPLRAGIRVHVELHSYDPAGRSTIDFSPDNEFKGFDAPPHALVIDDSTVYVPASMDILCYLSRHLTRHLFAATAAKPLPLKWSADIISIVERSTESIDWAYLKQFHPDILKRLEVFYSLTPMPESLAKIIPIRQIPPPDGLNQYPTGWPGQAFSQWRRVGFSRLLRQTFAQPPNWWLRLYYGIGERSVLWYGQVIYRLQILRRMFQVLMQKI